MKVLIGKSGTGIEKSGTGIEKSGTGIEKSGTGIEKSGTGIRRSGRWMLAAAVAMSLGTFNANAGAASISLDGSQIMVSVQGDVVEIVIGTHQGLVFGSSSLLGGYAALELGSVHGLEVNGSGTGSPDVNGSGTGQPDVNGSGTGQPDVNGSGTGQPDVNGSGTGKPEVNGSGTGNPEVNGSGTGNPEVNGSGTGQPEVNGSGTGQPDVNGSGTGQPDVNGSGTGQPESGIFGGNFLVEIAISDGAADLIIYDGKGNEIAVAGDIQIFGMQLHQQSTNPGFGIGDDSEGYGMGVGLLVGR